jgi:hypothetical protein
MTEHAEDVKTQAGADQAQATAAVDQEKRPLSQDELLEAAIAVIASSPEGLDTVKRRFGIESPQPAQREDDVWPALEDPGMEETVRKILRSELKVLEEKQEAAAKSMAGLLAPIVQDRNVGAVRDALPPALKDKAQEACDYFAKNYAPISGPLSANDARLVAAYYASSALAEGRYRPEDVYRKPQDGSGELSGLALEIKRQYEAIGVEKTPEEAKALAEKYKDVKIALTEEVPAFKEVKV